MFFLNIHDRHGWGDDYAQYVKEAENIAHGKPFYQSNYVYNELNTEYAPPQYPPGFPMLLAPAIKAFGLNIKALLYYNTLFYAALLFALFAYFRKYTGDIQAICLSLIISYGSFMIDNKGSLLSDVPCLLFITIYLWLRNSNNFSWKRMTALILTGTMAILIRSQGLILLTAEGLFFAMEMIRLLRRKKFTLQAMAKHPSFIIVWGIVLTYVLLNCTIFRSPNETLKFYAAVTGSAEGNRWNSIGTNANYLISLFQDLFRFDTNDIFWQAPLSIITNGIFILAILGFFISVRKKLRTDDLFFLVLCLFVIVFPPHQGTRYIIEAVAVYLLYAFTAASQILPLITRIKGRILIIIGTLCYLVMGYDTYEKAAKETCAYCLPNARDRQLIDYINTHVDTGSIIVFSKPRALALYCKPKFMNIAWQADAVTNKKQFDKLGVRYFLTGFDEMGYISNYLRKAEIIKDSVNIIDDFTLYRVR